MMSGSGAAMSWTKSHEPRSHTSSMISSHTTRARASMAAMRRGVNPALTSLRRRVWSGGSQSIIIGSGMNLGRVPSALENVLVSVPSVFTSR